MRLIQRIGLAGITAAAILAFAAMPASAGTHGGAVRVVEPGQSIQAAIDAAHPGDTIVLKSGDYAGGILISKDNITVRGAGRSTVLRDTGSNNCLAVAGPTGICVTNPAGDTVRGVTIKDLKVRDFGAFGVFGFGTDRLTVTGVAAIDNGEYGITEFESTKGAFIGNYVAGTVGDAGLYVGDVANARGTIVADNVAVGNALGVLVRHAHNVNVTGNTLIGNCVGVALVDDGQAGGQGQTRVVGNVINANNRTCPGEEDEGVPPLGGSGVIILGGQHNAVRNNTIIGNQGDPQTSPFAGGVVLAPAASPAATPAEHNIIVFNLIKQNTPADIIDESGSTKNVIKHNTCGTSQPDGLCQNS
jgi:nitrous oxidase accessory protein NosD